MPAKVRSLRRLAVGVVAALSLLVGSHAAAVPLAPAADDPMSSVGITKTNDTGGQPQQPGDEFIYTLTGQCSGLTVDCVEFTVTDTLPAEFEVTSLPQSTTTRDVTYDESTRLLTVVYKQTLQNPAGKTGLRAGQAGSVEIGMRVPTDTQLEDGATVTNSATVDAENADPKDSSTDVSVTIPRVVKPVTTKTWEDGSAIALSGEESTITLNVRNNSSSSAEVTELSVADTTADTFEYFDFESATVTAFPKGADQAHLVVTTADGQTHTGADISAPGELPMPAGVDPGDVVGFEVVFSDSSGDVLPYDTTGGTVEVKMKLRDTYRSSGATLEPTDKVTVNNCAVPSAQEKTDGDVAGAQACAPYDILPDILVLQPTKRFYPDTNGNFAQDNGEHAVLGENSPVSTEVDVKNASPFPVKSITITEPSAEAASEFDKIDVSTVRLRFPDGATTAHLTVTYADGSTFEDDYTANTTVDVAKAGTTVTKVEVTYTGVDADGNPTIKEGATAGLDLHGTLTDDVTAEDLPGGTSPGVDNCAGYKGDAGRTDGSGTASGNACKTLPIEAPNTSGSGTKDASQNDIPADQPITMNLKVTNNGNKPLVSPVITDPTANADGSPSTTNNPFDVVQITSVTVSPSNAPVKIELWDPTANGGSGAWVAYDANDAALLERATGVRGSYDGEMSPQTTFTVTVVAERRPGVPDGTTLQNCYSIDAGGDYTPGAPVCGPSMDTAPASDSASLNKTISPGTLPEYVPGLPRQHADMSLTVANTGNMSAKYLRMTDKDDDFFDAVDLVSIKSNQMPAGADRVQIDAYVDGAWVNGTPSAGAALPSGVSAGDVVGLRVTYSSTSTANDGYVIKPECTTSSCYGILVLDVSPRPALRSNGEPVPSHLEDTVSGEFLTKLEDPDKPKAIDPVDATLNLVKGDPVLDVSKTPNTVLAPGEDAPFYLKVTNTGTANVPDLVVKDALPPGIAFVDTFQGDDGLPYKITDVQMPAGTPALPTPDFKQQSSGGRISGLSWDFSKDDDGKAYVFPPGATFTIEIHVRLEAGINAGDVVTNTMGATSSDPDLACDGTSQRDGDFGDGLYCVASATLTAKTGAAFQARKWVSGNDSLGWYNVLTKEKLPAGDDSCLSTTDADGRRYTTSPCIALVNPGDQYHYLMRIQNAGTESGTAMRIVDRFPVMGDKGVILDSARNTAWDKRPTLASRPRLDGAATMTTSYETSEPLCTDDLDMGGAGSSDPQCGSDVWDDAYGPRAVGARFDLAFPTPLPPGGTVSITYAMDTPLDVAKNGDPTIAWNSYAHNETTDRAGSPRVLQPNEPIQVGVALAYGDLKLVKRIGKHPAALDGALKRVPFPFHVTCVIHPQGGRDRTVLDKDYRVSENKPVTVEGLPAGAECSVWETSARGGSSSHPVGDPVEVTIQPGLGETTVQTARIENDFEFGQLRLVKAVDGDAAGYADGRTFGVEVSCALPNASGAASDLVLHKTYEVGADEPVVVKPLPVNTRCWAEEVDTGGAEKAVVDHGTAGDPAIVTADGSGDGAVITVTNTFPAAELTVTKHVVNGDAGPYAFTLACTTGQGEVPLAAGDRAFELSDGESRTVSVPKGASCTVTETDVPSGDTVTYSASDGGDDGEVVVDGKASVEVTNTFPVPPEPDRPGHHGDKGHLADTGTRDWVLVGLLLMALALAGGFTLRRMTRAGRR
ncbi:DUF5979 domain-containing protein [Streptomyces sp. VRA16 Mangrove soil]|uniref:DUF5979 domain-containing protein n=1 Tax=Streptomyces sp. VRA16 Mangrove soil TaxID=2817434 RepID=UPI001A9F28CC|nr:DUF5979 domain-containing protein [Streptomyces sp. VRA16 Mangrove soil]MBO1333624.1 DUF11 domain-containing protein [Streptomyces sp. VRA16 Mangrove soil]